MPELNWDHIKDFTQVTEKEENFLTRLATRGESAHGTAYPRAISEMYLVKKLEIMTNKLTKSSDRNAKALNWLTFALVLATLANALALIFK